MDTSGFSQVGRYGTISLMKCNEPNAAITAFGINTEELTFGRDTTCSVRLYYPDVSLVHCKIIFEERKAFLVVLGANGLLVDGCKVYANNSPSQSGRPTTIPLSNNSDFEIHGKRFRFSYPPKELRAALMATPARPNHRALRLSMIQSAQVFTPRPSQDPRENLRILRSPLKNTFKSPAKMSPPTPLRTTLFAAPSRGAYTTPAKHQPVSEEQDEEDHIILVDGHHPRVVEEDKDLVILEDVEVPLAGSPISTPTQTQLQYNHCPQPQNEGQIQTPLRQRSLSRNTLHRAVLIRSAQRAVLKAESAEREREEEEMEEMEVLGAVAADTGSEDESDDDVPTHHEADQRHTDEEENVDESEEEIEEEGEEEEEEEEERRGRETSREPQKSVWRKSLERIWPFSSSSTGPHEEMDDGDDETAPDSGDGFISDDDAIKDEEEENQDNPAPLPTRSQPQASLRTPVRRALGSFMTPQVHGKALVSSNTSVQAQDGDVKPHLGRYSLGGGEARRVVRAEQLWRVKDIIVPFDSSDGSSNISGSAANGGIRAGVMGTPTRRQVVGDEERRAIQERRRSALREADKFFAGGIPGMGTPSTPIQARMPASSPVKSSTSSSTSASSAPLSKPSAAMKRDDKGKDDEDELDTRSLLDRMKETVEDMKRRRSLAPATPVRRAPGVGVGPGSLATPARVGPTLPRLGFGRKANLMASEMVDVEEMDESDKDEAAKQDGPLMNDNNDSEEGMEDREGFSLLRPGVMEEVRARDEEPVEMPNSVLSADKDIPTIEELVETVSIVPVSAEEDFEALAASAKKGTRARSSRPSPSPIADGDDDDTEKGFVDQNVNTSTKNSKSRAGSRRPKTSQPESAAQAEEQGQEGDAVTQGRTTTRRTPKPSAEPEFEEKRVETMIAVPARRSRRAATVEPEEPTVVPAIAAKRGRKPTVEPERETEKIAPAKRGRKAVEEAVVPPPAPVKRGVRKAAAPVGENEANEQPQAQAPVRRGRLPRTAVKGKNDDGGAVVSGAKRAMKARTADVEMGHDDDDDDDDDDPLDSIREEEPEPAAAAIPKPQGRKKATTPTMKEEVEDENPEKPAPPTTTRGAKAKSTALKTPAARGRGATKRTPATAPAAIQQGVNKENAPGSGESSGVELEPEESAKVKVRVSRTTRRVVSGTAAPAPAPRSARIKQEAVGGAPESEVPRARVMRATRARTRT